MSDRVIKLKELIPTFDWGLIKKESGLNPKFLEEILSTNFHISRASNLPLSFVDNFIQEKTKSYKYKIIFYNDRYYKEQSVLPNEIEIESIQSTIKKNSSNNFFLQANNSLSHMQTNIHLSGAINLEDTVGIFFYIESTPLAHIYNPNIVINCESETSATIHYHSENINPIASNTNTLINSSLVIEQKENSHIELVNTSKNLLNSFQLYHLHANLAGDASLKEVVINDNEHYVRNDIVIDLSNKNASITLNGLYSLKNDQHCDNHITINHGSPNTDSTLYFKGILDDESNAIYNGNIIISKNSFKSTSQQTNKNLLLSKKAHVNSRPVLEILNDDVKCSHGATVGDINKEELFYLQSRGISEENAKKIIYHAFAREIITKIYSHELRKEINDTLALNFERYNLMDNAVIDDCNGEHNRCIYGKHSFT